MKCAPMRSSQSVHKKVWPILTDVGRNRPFSMSVKGAQTEPAKNFRQVSDSETGPNLSEIKPIQDFSPKHIQFHSKIVQK